MANHAGLATDRKQTKSETDNKHKQTNYTTNRAVQSGKGRSEEKRNKKTRPRTTQHIMDFTNAQWNYEHQDTA